MQGAQVATGFPQNFERIRNEDFQTNCMIAITVTSLLSSIPYIRFGSSLASRGCSLILAGDVLICGYKTDNKLGVALKCLKIASIILSISAISLASYQMLIPALLTDMVFQGFQIVDLLKSSQEAITLPKFLGHISSVIVSALMTFGLHTGSNALLGIASFVNTITMSFFLWYSDRRFEGHEQALFTLLALQSFITITSFIRINSYTGTFRISNTTDMQMKITSRGDKPIGEIQPGESALFEAPYDELTNNQYDPSGKLLSHTVYYPSSMLKTGEIVSPIELSKVPELCIAGASFHSADEMEFEGPLTKKSITASME